MGLFYGFLIYLLCVILQLFKTYVLQRRGNIEKRMDGYSQLSFFSFCVQDSGGGYVSLSLLEVLFFIGKGFFVKTNLYLIDP